MSMSNELPVIQWGCTDPHPQCEHWAPLDLSGIPDPGSNGGATKATLESITRTIAEGRADVKEAIRELNGQLVRLTEAHYEMRGDVGRNPLQTEHRMTSMETSLAELRRNTARDMTLKRILAVLGIILTAALGAVGITIKNG